MKILCKSSLLSVLIVLTAFGLSACEEEAATVYRPEQIRIAVLPDQTEEALRQRYSGLVDYLSQQTGLPFRLIIPGDYTDLVNQFAQQNIDLAFFGGLTYLQARHRIDTAPLAMRDIDLQFKSYFLVGTDNKDLSWSDLKGKKLSFGSRLSTSGHLMPRYYLEEKGISAETYFNEVRFSGAHDKTASLVESAAVDIGAVNADIVDLMLADGRLDPEKIHIFYETPPYADYVWAANGNLDADIREKMLSAFLSLSADNAAQAEILDTLGAEGFVAAKADYFTVLDGVARQVGLLNVEDLN